MSRTIKITKAAGKATVVEVFENGVTSYIMAVNSEENFESDGQYIMFKNNDELDRLRLSVATLHADTATLLGTPADADELLLAMVDSDLFNSN